MNKQSELMRNIFILAAFILLCQGAGALGAFLSFGSIKTWYVALVKPPLTPPSWVFGPVWTTLYTMMAVAGWLVWRAEKNENRKILLFFFAAQLFFNALWTPLFFASHQILLALINIIILLAMIIAFIIRSFPEHRLASILMIPYALWVGFATYLNIGFLLLNH